MFIYLRVLAVRGDPKVKTVNICPSQSPGRLSRHRQSAQGRMAAPVIPPSGVFLSCLGLLLNVGVLQGLSRAVVAFCLLHPPKRAGSREGLGALAVPSICTHLRLSSCDPGRTLSGRSRLLLYRPECDNSFSCKAVIFPYLEEGWFFLKVRGVFWLWVGFLSPASRSCGCRGARLPRCLESSGCALCGSAGTPAPAEPPTSAGRQAGQAPAELLPVSHRYTPSQRAPHFLYHSITPKGCVRQAHPLLSSFPQTLTDPTGTTLPCAGQSKWLSQPQKATYLQDCNELLTLSCSNLWQKESH